MKRRRFIHAHISDAEFTEAMCEGRGLTFITEHFDDLETMLGALGVTRFGYLEDRAVDGAITLYVYERAA